MVERQSTMRNIDYIANIAILGMGVVVLAGMVFNV